MIRRTGGLFRLLGVASIVLLAGWWSLRPADAMIGKPAPDIASATWLNSVPLQMADFRGKVVLVEFWTFGCYNCRNVEPYIKQWHEKYVDQGLVVIGVHSPECSHEREVENVKRYMKEHDIRFPVPIDNEFSIWNRYGNRYWPAMYLIDKRGIIRYVKIGEGDTARRRGKSKLCWQKIDTYLRPSYQIERCFLSYKVLLGRKKMRNIRTATSRPE